MPRTGVTAVTLVAAHGRPRSGALHPPDRTDGHPRTSVPEHRAPGTGALRGVRSEAERAAARFAPYSAMTQIPSPGATSWNDWTYHGRSGAKRSQRPAVSSQR